MKSVGVYSGSFRGSWYLFFRHVIVVVINVCKEIEKIMAMTYNSSHTNVTYQFFPHGSCILQFA